MITVGSKKKKGKTKPEISINQLAEYIGASPAKRRTILKNAKYVDAFMVDWYKDVKEPIKKYLKNEYGIDDIEKIIKELRSKKNNPELTPHVRSVIKCDILALEKIINTDFSFLESFKLEKFKGQNIKVNISGTFVSIYPDLIITKEVKGKNHKGALKLHIAKDGLKEESMKIIGSMIYSYLDSVIPSNTNPVHLKLCISFDVFSKSFEVAPPAYKRRIKDVEAACEEIASRWGDL